MFVRAFLAGAYIAMGAALATVGSTGVADVLGAGIAQFILGALFPIGLVLVVLTGAELFTGDAMFAPMAVLQGHTGLKGLIYLWIVVYIGNLIGSLFMAFLVSYGPYTTWDAAGVATVTAFGTRAIAIASTKVSYIGPMGILSVFFKGILCNWLVCLALFLGLAADEVVSKILAIWFPIMAFVATGFEHCVANMYFIPAGIITNMIANGGADTAVHGSHLLLLLQDRDLCTLRNQVIGQTKIEKRLNPTLSQSTSFCFLLSYQSIQVFMGAECIYSKSSGIPGVCITI